VGAPFFSHSFKAPIILVLNKKVIHIFSFLFCDSVFFFFFFFEFLFRILEIFNAFYIAIIFYYIVQWMLERAAVKHTFIRY